MTDLWAKVRQRFLGSPFARGVAVLATGTALGQGVAFLAAPVLTRLYTPEDFGYLALYASLLSFLVVIASLRYHLAIPLPEADVDATSVLGVSLVALIVVTVVSSLASWRLGSPLLEVLNVPEFGPYLWLVPIGLLGAGTYQILSYWAVRKNEHKQLGATKLTQGVGMAATQVTLGLVSAGPVGLIVGDVVGRVAGSGNLGRLVLSRPLWRDVTAGRLWQQAIRYRRFPLLSSPSGLLNSAGLQLPSLVLLSLFGPQVAGWFALSQRVIGVPMTLLGTSVGHVYMGRASELARTAPAALLRLYRLTAIRLFLLALVPTAALVLAGPWLFAAVFGADWEQAGHYARILAPMFLIQFTAAPLSQTLNILERQDLQLAWDAGRLALVVAAFGIAGARDWPDVHTLIAFATVMSVAYVFLLGLNVYGLRQRRNAA